jgi:hypothetical protein
VRGSASSGGATVTLTVPFAIGGGEQVAVVATGVTNPTTAGSDVMRISTTSDTVPATTPVYPVGPSKPIFTAATPPLATAPGANEQYTFETTGDPVASYSLTSAPDWLSINARSGQLSGTVPPGTTSFSYSVRAANSAGTAVEGPYTVIVGAATTVSGSVVNGTGDPVTNVTVDACDPTDATCESAITDATGAFSVPVLAGADIVLTAYPPPGSGVTTASTGVLAIPADGLTGETITVTSGIPAIPGTLRINGSASPVVYWGSPSTASLTGCPDGLATVSVIGENTQTGKYDTTTIPLTETPAGSGNYTGTIPPEEPVHGPVQFGSAVFCPPQGAPMPSAGSAVADTNSDSAPTHAQAYSMSIQQIGTWIYNHLTDIPGLREDLALLTAELQQAVHPSCDTVQTTAVASIMLALAPLTSAIAKGITIAGVLMLLLEFPALAPLVDSPAAAAFIAWLVQAAISFIVMQAVTWYVHAFYSSYCAAPPKPNGLVDPSGTVLDTNGHPINGATVTILRSYTKNGAYLSANTSSPGILPAVNPQVTGADGVYHWDVAAGFYKVEASAPGCTVPGSARTTAVIGPYPVPPPQLGLSITLQCKNERPAAAPEVTSLSQDSGPSNGGTVLTVLGANFTPSSTVTFGDLPAKAVTYMSPQALTVTTPKDYGLVDVRVKTAGGMSAKNPADIFFFGSAPTVTKASPARGPASGGTTVTITGTGFAGVTEVSFGGVPARKFTVLSATTIIAVTGKALPGSVTVQVINPAGISPAGPAAAFRYLAPATPATASQGPVRRSPGVPTVG